MKQKQVIFRLTPSWQQSNLNNILLTGKIPLFTLIIATFACFFSSNKVILAEARKGLPASVALGEETSPAAHSLASYADADLWH